MDLPEDAWRVVCTYLGVRCMGRLCLTCFHVYGVAIHALHGRVRRMFPGHSRPRRAYVGHRRLLRGRPLRGMVSVYPNCSSFLRVYATPEGFMGITLRGEQVLHPEGRVVGPSFDSVVYECDYCAGNLALVSAMGVHYNGELMQEEYMGQVFCVRASPIRGTWYMEYLTRVITVHDAIGSAVIWMGGDSDPVSVGSPICRPDGLVLITHRNMYRCELGIHYRSHTGTAPLALRRTISTNIRGSPMGISRCTAKGNVLVLFSDGTLMCFNVDTPRRSPWFLCSSKVSNTFVLTGQEPTYGETVIGTGWRINLENGTHSEISAHHEIRDIACNGTSAVWVSYSSSMFEAH